MRGYFRSWTVTAALAVAIALSCPWTAFAADIDHIGTNQQVAVICFKWDDYATTRLASCADWATLLNNEIATFYDEATFGETTFVFAGPTGAPDSGWLSIGYDSTAYDFWTTGQDAVTLADPYFDYSNFHRVAVITNNPNFGGQGTWDAWWETAEGTEATFVEGGDSVDKRFMTLSIVNEWVADYISLPYDEAAAVVAHELGHHLELKTHYGSIGWFPGGMRESITPWSVMGLSPYKTHFLGWGKFERGWIPGTRVQSHGPPDGADIDTTITLSPNETGAGTQLIQLPITGGAIFTGYTVENRQPINGDEDLPSTGVLLSFVDENPNTIRKAVVLYDPGTPGDLYEAALEVGDSYTDTERNLTITYVSQTGDDVDVRIEYRLPPAQPPNPQITPWGDPPYETVDIWIDSEANGWGTYRYTDGSGNPVGNGDDAWVDHTNRLYFRVTNAGLGDATNVRVQAYANEPPGIGDSGADWRYLGTATFPSIAAGSSEEGYVNWKPTVGEHTCVKVVILETDTETTGLDNVAQENVTAFDTTSDSPYRARCMRFRVNNPFQNREAPVHLTVAGVPEGWKLQMEPNDFVLPPGESESVCLVVHPPEAGGEYEPGFIGKLHLQALVPYANTFVRIGGIDVWTHLTTESRLTCDSTDSGQLEVAPDQKDDALGAGLAPLRGSEPSTAAPFTPETLEDYFKESSLVAPEPEPPTITIGDAIEASGRLEPGFSGATVAVDFTSHDQRVTQLVTTDAGGNWTAIYDPDVGGIWEVRAHYAGDASRESADSNPCRFDVERDQRDCDYDSETAALVHWLMAVLALVAIVLFWRSYRERVCWAILLAALIFLLLAYLAWFVCCAHPAAWAAVLLLVAFAILYWWYLYCRKGSQRRG